MADNKKHAMIPGAEADDNFDCYYDESVKIDTKKMPEHIKEQYDLLEKAYREKNELDFLAYSENVELGIKACYVEGIVPASLLIDIRRKLGYEINVY
ncbi:MAG: hypothetical protein SOZ83_01675 [Sphaerochaetaceae bacterium]|nr:hypothetical protein [Sphaerochaetaceae bacterium]